MSLLATIVTDIEKAGSALSKSGILKLNWNISNYYWKNYLKAGHLDLIPI